MKESNTDDIKGRVKEATGALTGDEELKQEGEADQRAADVKGTVDRIADKVKGGIDDVKRRLTER